MKVQLTESVHLVASGSSGFGLTDVWDGHAYLVDGDETAALVDAGLGRGVDALLDNVAAAGVDPGRLRLLLVTHAHPDHCGAAPALARELPELQVGASPPVAGWLARADAEAMSVEAGKRSEFYPNDSTPAPCPVGLDLRDGTTVKVGALTVEAVATPGHAAGHTSYLLNDHGVRVLFGGDLAFFGGSISLLNTWDCDVRAYAQSLLRLRDAGARRSYPVTTRSACRTVSVTSTRRSGASTPDCSPRASSRGRPLPQARAQTGVALQPSTVARLSPGDVEHRRYGPVRPTPRSGATPDAPALPRTPTGCKPDPRPGPHVDWVRHRTINRPSGLTVCDSGD